MALSKEAVAHSDKGLEESLAGERELFLRSAQTESARARMTAAMAMGLQTHAVEAADLDELWKSLDGV